MKLKGSWGTTEYFAIIGMLIIEIILISMFATNFIIPGTDSAEIIESVSLGNSIATTINALSVQDEGTIKLIFSKEFLVVGGTENKKNYISVISDKGGKKENKVFLEAKLKNLIHQNTKSVTIKKERESDLIEVLV